MWHKSCFPNIFLHTSARFVLPTPLVPKYVAMEGLYGPRFTNLKRLALQTWSLAGMQGTSNGQIGQSFSALESKKSALCSSKSAKIACSVHKGLQKTALKARRGSKSQRSKARTLNYPGEVSKEGSQGSGF